MSSKKFKTKSNKTNMIGSPPIDTEKLYLFRKACEVAYRERNKGFWSGFRNSFRQDITWWSLQTALELVELYEEMGIEDLEKISNKFRSKLFLLKEGNQKTSRKTFRKVFKEIK